MRRHTELILICVFMLISCAIMRAQEFRSARPVWVQGREYEKNLFVGFGAQFAVEKKAHLVLRITGSTLYRIYVNGEYCGYGPARGPHGYYRVDEWDISGFMRRGMNSVAIEVAGYNVNSYYILDQPSFIQAEVIRESEVLASTNGEGRNFDARILTERVQKVQRYSFQRPFMEVYRMSPESNAWRTAAVFEENTVRCETVSPKKLLPRRIPFPRFYLRQPVRDIARGVIKRDVQPEKLWKDRSLTRIGPQLKGYPEEELEIIPSIDLQQVQSIQTESMDRSISGGTDIRLTGNSYCILDFGTNLTGFPGAEIVCDSDTRVLFTFDEILSDGDVDFKRLGCVNIVDYHLEPGVYRVESFEAYTFRYLKIIVLEGSCRVQGPYIREYVNPEAGKAHFASSDMRLNRLFEAGRETFRQNALDVFMDCPHRERAGWLCDSYFTSRSGYALCGTTTLEKNFFENFLMPESFAFMPDGMLPMCYPADHNDGVFIPNWSLWFVLQLEEYYHRSGDRELVDALKSKIEKLFGYFSRFLNSDGLLEKLESWVFIEWSKANSFVQDVNYPSNMLYAAALDAAARLYGEEAWSLKAQKIRRIIGSQSFTGEFFTDNAVRNGAGLTVTDNRTEVCQYFAFYFGIADPEKYPELAVTLRDDFGPDRAKKGAYPGIHEANSFVGNVLRLELLSRYGLCQQVLDESIDYLLYMAERTGTLWENVGTYASCNHGFASHVVQTLFRDVLGIYRIDPVKKTVTLRFSDLEPDWCEGKHPVADGSIDVRWQKSGAEIRFSADVPAGYSLDIINLSSRKVIREP